jgi:hypothetical protein
VVSPDPEPRFGREQLPARLRGAHVGRPDEDTFGRGAGLAVQRAAHLRELQISRGGERLAQDVKVIRSPPVYFINDSLYKIYRVAPE